MKTTVLQPKSLRERLLNDNEFCIAIAKRIYEDLGSAQIEKPIKQGRARFTECIKFEVMRAFRNQFEKFDLRFCVYTHYEKKELYNESNENWHEATDHFNYFSHPDMRVVARDIIEGKSPEEIAEAIQNIFKANVLLLGAYSGDIDKLKMVFKTKGIYLVMEEEINFNRT